MYYLVCLDDGHGENTAGKRTPILPDGSQMLENEFNHAVKQKIFSKLENYHKKDYFEVLFVAPGTKDWSLSHRSSTANRRYNELVSRHGKANVKAVFVSIHANAFRGVWGDWGGIETYHFPNSVEGRKLATILQKHLLKGTQLRNRGVKTANFHVLRETIMPAALVECGFMDNLKEAKLLMSDAYREETANELVDGVFEYFGKEFKETMDYKTPIQGQSVATAKQMAKFLLGKEKNPKIDKSVTVEQFCQMFLDEGARENIRGDIAFCQSIHETGWFRFGGQVLPEQNNYAGIGAVNPTPGQAVPRGASFNTPRDGIRAQIHHLKAYASKERPQPPIMSPRYDIVGQVHGFGSAPNWEDLNGKWAVPGLTYGQSILKIFEELMKVEVPEEPKPEPPKETDFTAVFRLLNEIKDRANEIESIIGGK